MRKGFKCVTFSHIDVPTGKKVFKNKRKYLTPEEAICAANKFNSYPNHIHKVFPYKCTTCHFFHTGRLNETNKID